jgi:hypothetical protein
LKSSSVTNEGVNDAANAFKNSKILLSSVIYFVTVFVLLVLLMEAFKFL